MVDPSLFTGAYDARLSQGLEASGLRPIWATRRLRDDEQDELGATRRRALFYRWTDGPRRRSGGGWRVLKAIEHCIGIGRLLRAVVRDRPLAVHFQWLLIPTLERFAIRRLRRHVPVVVTVHDVEPFNGKRVARAQRAGYDRALAAADKLIVHTAAGRDTLEERGLARERIAVIPHGLLATGRDRLRRQIDGNARWTIVQFGKIQHYKGVDLLVEALGRLGPAERDAIRVIVAGEPLIDVTPLTARAATLGLSPATFDLRPGYLAADAVEALLTEADAFVFPYRMIEASGAFMLVAAAGKWIVASRLGAFVDLIGDDGETGELFHPNDVDALAAALTRSVGRRPTRSSAAMVPTWTEIGRMTADVYREAASRWRAGRPATC